jgi:hypothetical protein
LVRSSSSSSSATGLVETAREHQSLYDKSYPGGVGRVWPDPAVCVAPKRRITNTIRG